MAKRNFSVFAKFVMFIEAGLILPFVYFCSLFSFSQVEKISFFVGSLIIRLSPSKKEEVRENLSVIFPDKIYNEEELSSISAKAQAYILRIFVETIKYSRMGIQDLLSCIYLKNGPEFSRIYRLSHEKKPQIFITMHAGNWELYGAFMNLLGFHMLSVVERQFNFLLDRHFQKLRTKLGIHIIYNEISMMRPLLKYLDGGGCAVLVADQNYWHSPIFLDFFGKEASAPQGIGSLALRCNRTSSFGASLNLGQGHYSIMLKYLAPIQISGDKEKDIMEFTKKIYSCYEDFIKKDVSNWFLLGSARWRLNKKTWAEWAKKPDSSPF